MLEHLYSMPGTRSVWSPAAPAAWANSWPRAFCRPGPGGCTSPPAMPTNAGPAEHLEQYGNCVALPGNLSSMEESGRWPQN